MQIEFFNLPNHVLATPAKLVSFFQELDKSTPNTKYLKVLHKKKGDKALKDLMPVVEEIKSRFENVLLVGMGGAINNPLSILSLNKNHNMNFHHLSTTDVVAVDKLLNNLELQKTVCIFLSNTGNTIETNVLAKYLCNHFRNLNLDPAQHFIFVVGSGDNALAQFAKALSAKIIPHEEDIGGRFSFFGPSSFLPALIADINIGDFIRGANEVIDDLWDNRENSSPALTALHIHSSQKPICVTMSYKENLTALLDLYTQLVAESLGKDSKGLTPIKAIGPFDQHSLLQLFLEGKRDKFYTLINAENNENEEQQELLGVHRAMFQATLTSLIETGETVRHISLGTVDEFSFGKLFMHFYAEVILLGVLMGVNPFDQPGVEQIKSKAKEILKTI